MSAPDDRFVLSDEAEAYLAAHDREPTSTGAAGIFLAIVGAVIVAASLIGGML